MSSAQPGLATDDSSNYHNTSAPNSQLPSPLSNIDETDNEIDDVFSDEDVISSRPTEDFTPKRRRSLSARAPQTSTSDRMDIPLAVALIPPLGTFLTGGDFLRDSLLLLLLFFYLHQLIKLPWDLYMASRPRGMLLSDPNWTLEQKRLQKLVETELKRSELVYLALSVMAPLLGAALLRYVGTALTGKDYISWFSTGIFVLVSGVRPWRHLSHRLHSRTEDLQEMMATFQHKGPDMPTRISELEKEVELLKSELATKRDMTKLLSDMNGALDVLDSALGRHEHAVEHKYHGVDERIAMLEKMVEEMMKDSQGSHHSYLSWISSRGSLFNRLNGPTLPVSKKLPYMAGRPARSRSSEYPVGEKRRRKSHISGRSSKHARGIIGLVLDLLLYPFSVGRTLLFEIVDFLRKHLT